MLRQYTYLQVLWQMGQEEFTKNCGKKAQLWARINQQMTNLWQHKKMIFWQGKEAKLNGCQSSMMPLQ